MHSRHSEAQCSYEQKRGLKAQCLFLHHSWVSDTLFALLISSYLKLHFCCQMFPFCSLHFTNRQQLQKVAHTQNSSTLTLTGGPSAHRNFNNRAMLTRGFETMGECKRAFAILFLQASKQLSYTYCILTLSLSRTISGKQRR